MGLGMIGATPRPWEIGGPAKKSETVGRPAKWRYVQHHFPDYPYEGELEDEYGIYPPLGESGPVALVAGRENAEFITRSGNAHDALVAVADELHGIMDTYREQVASGNLGTPGGLEHMGDVWRLLARWDRVLRAVLADA